MSSLHNSRQRVFKTVHYRKVCRTSKIYSKRRFKGQLSVFPRATFLLILLQNGVGLSKLRTNTQGGARTTNTLSKNMLCEHSIFSFLCTGDRHGISEPEGTCSLSEKRPQSTACMDSVSSKTSHSVWIHCFLITKVLIEVRNPELFWRTFLAKHSLCIICPFIASSW